jgi:predicted dehydrogenase
MTRAPVAVVGSGAIGRVHARLCQRHSQLRLVAIVDPAPASRDLALSLGVPWHAHIDALLAAGRPAGVIVATPTATHAEIGVACLQAGVPVLMEKPIAGTLADAQRLCDVVATTNVPMLVGHQRRHSARVQAARRLVHDGTLGRVVTVQLMATWLKPDAYFDAAWRRQPGGGPVLINLIHDVDLLRFLLGPVATVQAQTSNAVRGFAVEDTAVVLMRMAGGTLATLATSDCTVAPWNYDLGADENDAFAQADSDALWLCGTQASLTVPRLQLWRHAGARGWAEPLQRSAVAITPHSPYEAQLTHWRAVIDGRKAPLCSADDALHTLRAAQAVHEAAASGGTVTLNESAPAGEHRCPA